MNTKYFDQNWDKEKEEKNQLSVAVRWPAVIRAELMVNIWRLGYLELSPGPYRLKYIDLD